MAQPEATRKQQQQAASQVGMAVSVQGLEQRFNEASVVFMRRLLEIGLEQMVNSQIESTLLPQFNGVYITDCTRLVWGKTGVKMGVRWELQQGQLQAHLSELKQNDQKTAVVDYAMPVGALHLGDLGFFKLRRFQDWNARGIYWLSRLKVGTRLWTAAGDTLDILQLLGTATTPFVMPVQVGVKTRFAAYLVAAPTPEAACAKRCARLKEQARLDMRPLSARQAALAGWTLYLTNIPQLTFDQAHILARTRWQIELLFKLWKSHAKVLVARSADPIRQQCEGYAKLLGVLVAHWLLLVSGWQPHMLGSLDALRLLRTHIPLLMRAFRYPILLPIVFDGLQAELRLAPLPSKRRAAPLAFQLWQSFSFAFP